MRRRGLVLIALMLIAAFSVAAISAASACEREGCTPGYWKNHAEDWVGFSPDADFDTVFGVDFFDPDITLMQAAHLGGGGVKALARHGVAALLSAAHPDVAYKWTEAEVIALVQAGRKGPLVRQNEKGCPL